MNAITTVEDVRRKFHELVAGLDVDPRYKVFHTTPRHDGSPHIVKGDEFCFVVTERGSECERIRTTDPDEILYMLLDGITQVIAIDYELRNRVAQADGREVWFPYQEQLLHDIKPEWGARKRREHREVLTRHPFRKRAEPRR